MRGGLERGQHQPPQQLPVRGQSGGHPDGEPAAACPGLRRAASALSGGWTDGEWPERSQRIGNMLVGGLSGTGWGLAVCMRSGGAGVRMLCAMLRGDMRM